jgi:shikimate kinase
MSTTRNIYLVGPMGSGKSAVGRKLAAELGLEFCDSDDVIESRTGVDIPFIFDKEGELGFRRREADLIRELTQRQGIVLATGGGAATNVSSRRLLADHGTVVYLYTTVPEQIRRTSKSRNRPLLQCDDPAAVLAELMAARDPLYREMADLVMDTDGKQVNSVVQELKKYMTELPDGQ